MIICLKNQKERGLVLLLQIHTNQCIQLYCRNMGLNIPSPTDLFNLLEINNVGFGVGFKIPNFGYFTFGILLDLCRKKYSPDKYDLDIIFILSDDMPIRTIIGLCDYLHKLNVYFYDSSGIEMSKEEVISKFNIDINDYEYPI